MKTKTILFIFLSWLMMASFFGCNRSRKYEKMLNKARANKEKIQEKQKREQELSKQSFEYYKKVYAMDKDLLGKNELFFLGNMYARFERNEKMKQRLHKESETVERKSI